MARHAADTGVMAERWPVAPEGFLRRATRDRALYAAAADQDEILSRGMDDPEACERILAQGDATTGRGASTVIARPDGASWRLKKLRRGGLLGPLWGDRYPSAARLIRTLDASREVARRGVPTPRAIALLADCDRGLLVQAFLATEEIEGAEDLARRAARGAASERDLEEAMRMVRLMHDRGIDHPDLNLGNVILAAGRAHVIDLDGVSFAETPLPVSRRRRAIRRLERSCAKLTGSPGFLGKGSEDLWYMAYADRDEDLARRLAGGRSIRRFSIAVHRLGWRSHPR